MSESNPVYVLYARPADQEFWTVDGQPYPTEEEAERQRTKVIGQQRGRNRIAHATVIRFPSAADVAVFVRVGREKEVAPTQASPVLRAVPRPLNGKLAKQKAAAGTAPVSKGGAGD